MKGLLSVLGALVIIGGPIPLPSVDIVEKITLGGLFAGLLWFVLGQFRELAMQVRAQNDALISAVKDNATAMHSVAKRLDDLEDAMNRERNKHDGR